MHVRAAVPIAAREILKGLHPPDLRNLARDKEVTTEFQSAAYVHRVRSRSRGALRVCREGGWSDADRTILDSVHRYLPAQRLIQVDLQVCASEPTYHVRLYVPRCCAELACMAARAMLPAPAEWVHREHAEITAIVLPEWSQEPAVLVDCAASTAHILGSDYYGDIHNSVLRLVAQQARARGHLALHAGSAEIIVRSKAGGPNHCGLLIFGAGGAGKSTLVSHDYGLDAGAGERASIRQDDRVILHPSGFVQGTEGQGLYVRTLGLSPRDRPALFAACTHEDAVLENVWVSRDGSIDFASDVLTTNGRAIAPIRRIAGADGQVDLPRCTHMVFLVRDDGLPPVERVDAAQAAETFLAGEAGEAGHSEELRGDADRLLAFLRANPDVLCFRLNTAKADAGQAAIAIREICRQGHEWRAGT
jgi:phosphoenolpyruvate carboxykinase (ATP)